MTTTVNYILNETDEIVWTYPDHTGPIPPKEATVKAMIKRDDGRLEEMTLTVFKYEFVYTMQGNLTINILCYKDYSATAYLSLY